MPVSFSRLLLFYAFEEINIGLFYLLLIHFLPWIVKVTDYLLALWVLEFYFGNFILEFYFAKSS